MQGRVALVTGASRGIGEYVARRFAADGAAVAVSARTVEEGDHPLPGSISGTGGAGPGGGVGGSAPRRFAAEGAAVAVSARTVEEGDHPLPGSISGTVESIRQAGGTAIAVAADLGKQEDRTRLIETVERELG